MTIARKGGGGHLLRPCSSPTTAIGNGRKSAQDTAGSEYKNRAACATSAASIVFRLEGRLPVGTDGSRASDASRVNDDDAAPCRAAAIDAGAVCSAIVVAGIRGGKPV